MHRLSRSDLIYLDPQRLLLLPYEPHLSWTIHYSKLPTIWHTDQGPWRFFLGVQFHTGRNSPYNLEYPVLNQQKGSASKCLAPLFLEPHDQQVFQNHSCHRRQRIPCPHLVTRGWDQPSSLLHEDELREFHHSYRLHPWGASSFWSWSGHCHIEPYRTDQPERNPPYRSLSSLLHLKAGPRW